MKRIVIIGSGGFAKEVVWLIHNINKIQPTWDILGFIESAEKSETFGKTVFGYTVLGDETWITDYKQDIYVACAIGNSSVRKAIHQRLSGHSYVKFATLIDPSVYVHESVQIGFGTIICRNVTLTVDIKLGEGVLINIGTVVGHDVVIEDFSTILVNCMISGKSKIGECCEIGSGAFIFQGKTLTPNCIVAPLAAVLRNLKEPGTYAGNPAIRIF